MDLKKFIQFAKDKYDLDVKEVPKGEGLTFKDIFGVDFSETEERGRKNECDFS